MSACQSPIIVALDFPTREAALALADQLDPKLCRVKVGKELFTSCAAGIVETLRGKGFEVFLDLKFHDIPNTTAMAVKAAAEMGVWMVNVHCSGGLRMMAACRETLEAFSGPRPLLIGVTVLTSMEREDLAGIGLDIEPQEQVLRLAALAQKAGMDGLVCSAQEAPALKAAHPGLQLVTPGIRPAGSAQDDQRRILTPRPTRPRRWRRSSPNWAEAASPTPAVGDRRAPCRAGLAQASYAPVPPQRLGL